MSEDKRLEVLKLMGEAVQGTGVECPGCHTKLSVDLGAVWKPHTMTLQYNLNEGHKMGVEEFADSIKALARCLKVMAKEMGAKAQVLIDKLETSERMVSITVAVAKIAPPTPPQRMKGDEDR